MTKNEMFQRMKEINRSPLESITVSELKKILELDFAYQRFSLVINEMRNIRKKQLVEKYRTDREIEANKEILECNDYLGNYDLCRNQK